MLERLRWRYHRLDLDDPNVSLEELEVFAADSGLKTPRHMSTLFLQLVLRRALADRAMSMNVFHDTEDDCLRTLQYVRDETTGELTWIEFHPAPGELAQPVLRELRKRIGVRRVPGQGSLRYRYRGCWKLATAAVPSKQEFQIHFTAARPPMRTKVVPE